jgi:type II secretory pathway pseudopilin PulG
MNVRLSTPHSALRTPRLERAFTMVEIALSLAIIGFALVAIIGVLPAGMSVQKDNREQTIINLDAAFLMDALRTGPQGQDDLTNYVVSITNIYTLYSGSPLATNPSASYSFNATQLTSGQIIIGLLSTPKYILTNYNGFLGFYSNSVTAVFRAINAPAVDQGLSQASRDFAFQYLVTIEISPTADYAFASANGTWLNLTSLTNTLIPGGSSLDDAIAQNLQNNMHEMRLTFRWPVLPNGQLGGGKQVFRSSVAGTFQRVPLLNWPSNYFIQPLTYTAQTP